MRRLLMVLAVCIAIVPAWGKGNFAGIYETTYGRMELLQDGDHVTGTYDYAGGSTMDGWVEGERLVFRYAEPTVEGDGWFEFTEDGLSIIGEYRPDGSDAWGAWNGTRIDENDPLALPNEIFGGSFDSTFGRLDLDVEGSHVTGVYEYGGGSTIDGWIENGRLVFTYSEPSATGEGWFEISPDGRELSGEWREDGSEDWHSWTAERIEPGIDEVAPGASAREVAIFHYDMLAEGNEEAWASTLTEYNRESLAVRGGTATFWWDTGRRYCSRPGNRYLFQRVDDRYSGDEAGFYFTRVDAEGNQEGYPVPIRLVTENGEWRVEQGSY